MKSRSTFQHVPSTGSTNQDLLISLQAGEDPAPLLADHQRAGRGRLGRSWYDLEPDVGPAQAMLGSIPQRWNRADPGLPLVPFMIGLATLEALRQSLGQVPARLWWPNDVVVNDGTRWRKLGGILVEATAVGDAGELGVVAGIGLNLTAVGSDADPSVRDRAISVAELSDGWAPSNRRVFAQLIDCVAVETARLRTDPTGLMGRYRSECATLGRSVEVHTSDGVIDGVARGLTDGGRLIVDGPAGRVEVAVGDVVARPT